MVGRAVDVGARVSQYEVTSTPLPGVVGRGRLRLVWVRPPEVLVEAETEAEAVAAGSSTQGTLAVLDAYRITRVPGRLAG